MPKNKFQEVVFALIMSFFMVLAMELYNGALRDGMLTADCLTTTFQEMTFMIPICFIISFFFMDPLAQKKTFKLVRPGKDPQILITVVRAGITVCLMCPCMSLCATLIFKQPELTKLIPVWLTTFVKNFPMALCWQVFFCGPLVRFIFRSIFARNDKVAVRADNQKIDRNKEEDAA